MWVRDATGRRLRLDLPPMVRVGARVLLAAGVVLLAARNASAVEPAEEFLAGLRERGLHELALDYLTRMETSPLADAEFKKRIPFHRGAALVELSRQTVDPEARARLLDEARTELGQFAQDNPSSVAGAKAQLQLASVFVEQAKQGIARAQQLPSEAVYNREREQHYGEARELLDEARELFQQADAAYSAELQKLTEQFGAAEEADPSEQGDATGQPDQRQEYRGRLAQVRVLAAQTQFDKAQTYAADSAIFRELNQEAAKELGSLYELYSRWLVGLYAHLYEGRCYQALGDYPRALGCYEQLISQPSVHPAFRTLIASAYRYQAECFIAQGKYDAAIAGCSAWLDAAQAVEAQLPERLAVNYRLAEALQRQGQSLHEGSALRKRFLAEAAETFREVARYRSAEALLHQVEAQLPEWLAVRYRLAEALQHQGESLREGSAERKRLLAEAAEAFHFVAGSPGEFQAAARTAETALAKESGKTFDVPRDFVAAYEAGKAAIASANAARVALGPAVKNSPDAVGELRAQIERGTDDARHYFRLATTLVDDDTDLAMLNEVRYFLCWLYWDNGDYYQAAVLGEFLARRYPDHPAASAAAKLAMASYERLYQAALQAASRNGEQRDTEFEARRMAQVAEFITRRWPGTPDADAAFSVLVTYAIRNGRIEDAEQLLEDASSRHRPQLELQLGIAMWGRYLELANLDGAPRPGEEALGQMKGKAVALLQSGFEVARKSTTVNETTATAALYLVQAMLSEGQFQSAIDLLQDGHVGPLTLVAGGLASASRPDYAVEVYKAAVRAYVSVTPPRAEQALDAIQALEAVAGRGGQPAGELTRVYIGLGQSLEQQMQQLRDAGRDREAAQVRKAFTQFLDQLSARGGDRDWASRQWIAQMYYELGEGLAENSVTDGTARQYFTKARDAYRQMLAAAASSSSPPGEDALLVANKQLGDCLRRSGQYQEALDAYSAVLKDKEAWLAAQYAAASAYQERGQAEHPKWLERAIYGGYRLRSTGKNRIWGWLRLAQVADRAARSDAKYRDMFFDARFNAARCRYWVAMKSEGADRGQHLTAAKQSIRSMMQLYPDLGGDRWKPEFDRLLKEIQQAAGEQPEGLHAFAAAPP